MSAESQVRYELETRFQQLQSRLAAVTLETEEVRCLCVCVHDVCVCFCVTHNPSELNFSSVSFVDQQNAQSNTRRPAGQHV